MAVVAVEASVAVEAAVEEPVVAAEALEAVDEAVEAACELSVADVEAAAAVAVCALAAEESVLLSVTALALVSLAALFTLAVSALVSVPVVVSADTWPLLKNINVPKSTDTVPMLNLRSENR